MSDHYKTLLTSQLYMENVVGNNETGSTIYVEEQYVKEAYDKLFGEGYYNTSVQAYYQCYYLNYNPDNKRFEAEWIPCGWGVQDMYDERIIKAEKYSDLIEITSVVWFKFSKETEIYKDINGLEKIDFIISGESDEALEESTRKFVNTYKDELQQYTYTFKLNENGSYNYYGVERTKN